jgi:hypothetical protein
MATTPNFGWPTPDDTDQVSAGAAAIRNLGNAVDTSVTAQGTAITGLESDVADKVDKDGDTMTGGLVAPNVSLGVTTATSDTVALDFSTGDGFVSRQVGGTAVVVTGANYTAGATKTVRFVGGAAVASLDVPADWVFVGSAAGTALGTAVTAVISATAFGTAESDVVAAFAEEA